MLGNVAAGRVVADLAAVGRFGEVRRPTPSASWLGLLKCRGRNTGTSRRFFLKEVRVQHILLA